MSIALFHLSNSLAWIVQLQNISLKPRDRGQLSRRETKRKAYDSDSETTEQINTRYYLVRNLDKRGEAG